MESIRKAIDVLIMSRVGRVIPFSRFKKDWMEKTCLHLNHRRTKIFAEVQANAKNRVTQMLSHLLRIEGNYKYVL